MSTSPRTIDTSELSGQEPTDLRRVDRWMEQASWIMMPTGFILIILGWFGASRTPLLFEQVPYLISGGLLGLGLVIGGGLLYVGSWIARAAQVVPEDAKVSNLAGILQGLGLANGNGHAAPLASGQFFRTPSGGMFHRADCAVVAGRADVKAVPTKEVDSFKPCGMCDPLAV